MIMAPIIERQKGTHQKLMEHYIKEGFQEHMLMAKLCYDDEMTRT
jgi:excinuclease UvrABC ATPase subunit